MVSLANRAAASSSTTATEVSLEISYDMCSDTLGIKPKPRLHWLTITDISKYHSLQAGLAFSQFFTFLSA